MDLEIQTKQRMPWNKGTDWSKITPQTEGNLGHSHSFANGENHP
jgi:hypothetical protein